MSTKNTEPKKRSHKKKPAAPTAPKLPDDLRKCVECDRYIRTRMVNGKRIYIFHNVSEVPHARACGMAGQELE